MSSGQNITVVSGANSQTFVLSASAAINATSVTITAQTANFSYPIGSIVSGDIMTLTRQQYGTTAQSVAVGWAVDNAVTANLLSQLLPRTGGAMTGAIAMGANKITGVANGSAAQDVAAFGQIPTEDFDTQFRGPAGGTAGICLGETIPRWGMSSGALGFTSGTLYMTAIYLPVGVTVTKLGWSSGNNAATSPTHQWLALFDNNRNMLANTADQTTAAIASSTPYQYSIAATAAGAASSFTTTYAGLYYFGILLTATTMPLLSGALSGVTLLQALSPVYCGSSSAETSPPSYPFQASAIAASTKIPYMWAA
jgi:hypothetical protein